MLLFSRVIRALLFALSAAEWLKSLRLYYGLLIIYFFFFFLLVSEWVWMINKQRRLVDKYTRFGSKNVIFISLHSLTFFSPFTPLASHHIYHRNSRELICVLSRVYLLNKAVPANSSHPIFVTTGEVFLYFFIVR